MTELLRTATGWDHILAAVQRTNTKFLLLDFGCLVQMANYTQDLYSIFGLLNKTYTQYLAYNLCCFFPFKSWPCGFYQWWLSYAFGEITTQINTASSQFVRQPCLWQSAKKTARYIVNFALRNFNNSAVARIFKCLPLKFCQSRMSVSCFAFWEKDPFGWHDAASVMKHIIEASSIST